VVRSGCSETRPESLATKPASGAESRKVGAGAASLRRRGLCYILAVFFDAVIFDWRGTLVTTLSEREWVRRSLALAGREARGQPVEQVLSMIREVDGDEDRLDAPGVDASIEAHRSAYMGVFADAGIDDDLAAALYAVESDYRHNIFAVDATIALSSLHQHGMRLAVLSDIHFDLRPAFDAAGLGGLVDVFTLSYEHGHQKPHPDLFASTLTNLGVPAEGTLMVGDRSGPDGPAVEQGITTLLLPPLKTPQDRRLHLITALCGIPAS
jgi:FMN phosphatase YigB (HAD superfamily)